MKSIVFYKISLVLFVIAAYFKQDLDRTFRDIMETVILISLALGILMDLILLTPHFRKREK